MRTLLLAFGVIVLWGGQVPASGQEDKGGTSQLSEVRLEKAREEYFRMKAEEGRRKCLPIPGV